MHKKICKGVSSAIPGDGSSGTDMLQSAPDNAESLHVKPSSMPASTRAKLQKEVLQTVKSPQHFLASITLPMLKGFLKEHAHFDVKPFESHLKRTSDWVDIILKRWQNKDMDLQVRPIHAVLWPLVDAQTPFGFSSTTLLQQPSKLCFVFTFELCCLVLSSCLPPLQAAAESVLQTVKKRTEKNRALQERLVSLCL